MVGIVAWLTKTLISQWLARDIERFKAALANENTRSLDEFRAELQLESQRQQIVFGSLHSRRAEVIAELYGKLTEMDRAGRRLLAQQWYREIREGVDRQFGLTREPSVMRPGYELLSPSEQKDVESLRGAATDFAQFYERNRIYFTHEACLLIDQFHSLSSYFASNYESIAFKDKEGRPYVNPEVKRVWDGAVAKIPELKDLLDREFRGLLGVTSVNKKPEATRTE